MTTPKISLSSFDLDSDFLFRAHTLGITTIEDIMNVMRTNVLSFFSSGSVAESFAKAWETIGSKLGLSINIQLNNRRPNGDVLIQESLIPISKTTSKNLSNNVQPDSFVPCFHKTDL